MKVECPYKDWEGEQAFLALHMKEIHKIDANPTSIPTIEQVDKIKRNPDFFMKHLNENLNSKFFWITVFAVFILGVIFANSV